MFIMQQFPWSASLGILHPNLQFIETIYYITAWIVSTGKQVLWEDLNWKDSYYKA